MSLRASVSVGPAPRARLVARWVALGWAWLVAGDLRSGGYRRVEQVPGVPGWSRGLWIGLDVGEVESEPGRQMLASYDVDLGWIWSWAPSLVGSTSPRASRRPADHAARLFLRETTVDPTGPASSASGASAPARQVAVRVAGTPGS